MKVSNNIYIHFSLEKGIGKIVILKKHAETLHSILKILLRLFLSILPSLFFHPYNGEKKIKKKLKKFNTVF